MYPNFTSPLDAAAETAPLAQRGEGVNAQRGTARLRVQWTDRKKEEAGDVSLHTGGNDRVAAVELAEDGSR